MTENSLEAGFDIAATILRLVPASHSLRKAEEQLIAGGRP
jgi:hypothetical protein